MKGGIKKTNKNYKVTANKEEAKRLEDIKEMDVTLAIYKKDDFNII